MSTTTRRSFAWHQHFARTVAGILCIAAVVLIIGACQALGQFCIDLTS